MSDMDESALIQAAQSDPSAFAKLYEIYVDRIYNYVYHRVGNSHDAEDLTSRTFYRAMSHLPKYVDKGLPFSAWLYRIAHNLVANFHRDRKRRPMVSLDDIMTQSAPDLHPEMLAMQEDDKRFLVEVIQELDSTRQELILLKFGEGLSNTEIGRVLGRSEGAIKSLYHRTLLQIRREMKKKGLKLA